MIFCFKLYFAGKSALIAGMMGENYLVSGQMKIIGTKSYVAHQPWMQNISIKENILFGKPLISSRYEKTLECCALLHDLKSMENGDKTEVGEDGANLSGGQKQRLNLARAVYSDSDILLLDDVLSALDGPVGKLSSS